MAPRVVVGNARLSSLWPLSALEIASGRIWV